MFCQNCGRQLPDGVKFCGSCGTKVEGTGSNAQQFNSAYVPQQNVTKKQPKKKKANFLIIAVVLLAFYFIGRFAGGAVAKSMTDAKETTPPTTTQSTIAIEPVSNPEYAKVFSERFLVPDPALFFGLDSDSFVNVDDNGIVDHQQFGYKDDLVVEFRETVYIPTEGWTDAEKESYEQTIWDTYGDTGVECATLTRVIVGGLYIYFTLEYKGMDKAENIRAAADAGLIIMDNPNTLWGMSATEESLLAQGFIKK